MKTAGHALAVILIFTALVMPNRLSAITMSAFGIMPLELLLLGLVLLIRGGIGLVLRAFAAMLLAIGFIFKLADMGCYQAFGRPVNPVLDSHFLADGMNLLQGILGQGGAVACAVLLFVLVIAIIVSAFVLLGLAQSWLSTDPKASLAGLCLALLVWTALLFAGWQRASTPFYDLWAEHISSTATAAADLKDFIKVVDGDPYANVANEQLFKLLKGKDVLEVFVESYGRTVLEKSDFASHIRPLLAKSSAQLTEHGLFARSAYLTSPTNGGISWLAHSTLVSGLWVNSQTRYDRLVMSKRPTLNHLFQRAGWRTVAVQPAHTMDWPQGRYFGYDQIYAAQDLDYRGLPFNWITMPDQFTLLALQSRERKSGQRAPVMAEVALISSHAPWTPLPKLVAWDQVGDGGIFNQQAREGDEPELVWKNTERIRTQYRKSIEYALANIVSYAVNFGDENLVLLVLGDHQPAPFVADETKNRDVLVHLISKDPKVMTAVEDWHWTEGMLPADKAPVWGMDKMRDRFIGAFSK